MADLLEHGAHEPGVPIRALARGLDRDYKRGHGDVTALERFGLIEREPMAGLCAPYNELAIRASLDAAA